MTRALKARLRRAAGELRDGLVCGTRQVLVERVVRAGRCASLGGRQTTATHYSSPVPAAHVRRISTFFTLSFLPTVRTFDLFREIGLEQTSRFQMVTQR